MKWTEAKHCSLDIMLCMPNCAIISLSASFSGSTLDLSKKEQSCPSFASLSSLLYYLILHWTHNLLLRGICIDFYAIVCNTSVNIPGCNVTWWSLPSSFFLVCSSQLSRYYGHSVEYLFWNLHSIVFHLRTSKFTTFLQSQSTQTICKGTSGSTRGNESYFFE